MFVKKIFILNEINNAFAASGKNVGGLLRLTGTGNNASAQICLTNVDISKMGKWQACLRIDGDTVVKDIYNLHDTNFAIKAIDNNCEVDLLICLIDGKAMPVAYATNKSFNTYNENLLQYFDNDNKINNIDMPERTTKANAQPQQNNQVRNIGLSQPQNSHTKTIDYSQIQVQQSSQAKNTDYLQAQNNQAKDFFQQQHTTKNTSFSQMQNSQPKNVDYTQEKNNYTENTSYPQQNKNIDLPQIKQLSQDELELIDYEKFVAAAENYYAQENIAISPISLADLKAKAQNKFTALEEFSNAFDAYASKPQGNYYIKIKNQLDKLFSDYPPYLPLMDKIEESYWVKIDYADGKYFAIGLLLDNMLPKYLAYAVPSNALQYVTDNSFQLLGDSQDGYYILYQDANTGECIMPT